MECDKNTFCGNGIHPDCYHWGEGMMIQRVPFPSISLRKEIMRKKPAKIIGNVPLWEQDQKLLSPVPIFIRILPFSEFKFRKGDLRFVA
jgi:hypothetical protein